MRRLPPVCCYDYVKGHGGKVQRAMPVSTLDQCLDVLIVVIRTGEDENIALAEQAIDDHVGPNGTQVLDALEARVRLLVGDSKTSAILSYIDHKRRALLKE